MSYIFRELISIHRIAAMVIIDFRLITYIRMTFTFQYKLLFLKTDICGECNGSFKGYKRLLENVELSWKLL